MKLACNGCLNFTENIAMRIKKDVQFFKIMYKPVLYQL